MPPRDLKGFLKAPRIADGGGTPIPPDDYKSNDSLRIAIIALRDAIDVGIPDKVEAAYEKAVAAGAKQPLDYQVAVTLGSPQLITLRELAAQKSDNHTPMETAALNPGEFPDHQASFRLVLRKARDGRGMAGTMPAQTGVVPTVT